jgi:isopenicillin N synthase-like dioxygenase
MSSYAKVREIAVDEIPVIDISALLNETPEGLAAVGAQIRRASEEIGFFYVRNHGVDDALIKAADLAARAFFALPMERKMTVKANARHRGFLSVGEAKMYGRAKVDLKESFVWGLELPESDPDVMAGKWLVGPNQWPDFEPSVQRDLYAYYEAMVACGLRLMRGVAAGLGVDPAFFAAHFQKPLARGSVVYYPPQPSEMGAKQFGVAPHTDYGCLTLVWQDEVGGLQVRGKSGDWVTAHPIPGTFVVNVGDLLARWSNDRFASTPHRVINSSGRERHSMALFFDADTDAVVNPRDLFGAEIGETQYKPVTCGEYVKAKFDAAFAYRQTQA